MKLEIQATRVLQKTIEAEKDFKIICHQGGSRSSKTWSIFQFFLLKALAGDKLRLTIVRDKLTWIKSTLLVDFKEILDKYDIPVTPEININRSEQIYNVNGTEFAFFGLDYAEKLHGRGQDWFWINETMEVAKKHFDQLEMRTKIGGILDFNPYDDMHWAFDLVKRDDVKVIRSSMLDNPFLPDIILNKIRSYEPTEKNYANGTADEYMWQVYGLGIKGKLQGTIFNNWDIIEKLPEDDEGNIIPNFIAYGMDFGYTNDPTAMSALYMMDNELYWKQLIYRTGLTNQDICNELKVLKVNRTDEIWADSAEPKSIEEIRRAGFNIRAVKKGADSVMFGIDLLKQYKMHIVREDVETESELRKYKYAEDKAGRLLNKPIDAFNHAIDEMRYVAMMKLGRVPQIQILKGSSLGL